MTRRLRLSAALLFPIIVCGSAAAWAQTSSSIIGTVKDDAGAALSGVTVTLQGMSVPGEPQTVLTNGRGQYRFPQLAPGLYAVTAVQQGRQAIRRTNLRVPVGATLTVDMTLVPPSGPDPITINRAGPMVDVTSSASTTKLTSEDLESLPIGAGAAMLQLLPGVTARTAFGGPYDTSRITADTAPITVTGRNELVAAAIHPNWMQEAQILGLGAGFDYGEFSGLVANIALRSGTNTVSGLLEHRTTPSRWVADNRGGLSEAKRVEFEPEKILSRWDSSAQLGGPIDRDRLFFFSGFHYDRNRARQAGTIGSGLLNERSPSLITKLSWLPERSLKVDGFVESDKSRVIGRMARNATPETANDQTFRTRSWNGHVSWSPGASTLVDVQGGGVLFDFQGIPAARRAGPPTRFDRVTGIRSGNLVSFQDLSRHRYLAGASLSRFLDGFAGRGHTLKIGFEFERTTLHQVAGTPAGQSYRDANGVPEEVELWAGDIVSVSGIRSSMYLQDSWSAGRRVTVQPGVRASVDRGSTPDKGTVFKTNPVSPRIGVAWDVTSDHKTVVRAAYHRLHEPLETPTFSFMNTSGRSPRITAKVIGPDDFQEIDRTSPDQNVAVADNLRHAYVDQYLAGVERELAADVSLTVQYIARTFGDIWALVNTGSQWALVQARDPGPDGQLSTPDDGDLVDVYNVLNPGQTFTVLANPEGAYRRYRGVQVVGQKRFSHGWQGLAAYTWSRTRGTVNPSQNDTRATGTDTGQNGVFSNPNRRINADGPTSSDYTHQLTMQGVYVVPLLGGLNVSAEYRYLSGGAWGRTAVLRGPQLLRNQTVRIERRGTRRIEGSGFVDARLEKTFRLGGSRRSLGIFVDLLNLANQGVPLTLSVTEVSGATLGDPTDWATPRTLRIAGRVRF